MYTARWSTSVEILYLPKPVQAGDHCDHDWTGGKKSQACLRCKATCIRDDRGVIVDYDRMPGKYIEGIVDQKTAN